MRVLKEESIAVIIDIQERLFPLIFQHEWIEKNCKILIQGLKALEIPILVTQQYTKGLGNTIEPIRQAIGEHKVWEKTSFSCFDDSAFSHELTMNHHKFVIIAGIESHVCVLQTAIDLLSNGFTPVIVEDCVSSRTENSKKVAMERLREEGAIITTCESLLFELCRYSGTPVFKAISNLVK